MYQVIHTKKDFGERIILSKRIEITMNFLLYCKNGLPIFYLHKKDFRYPKIEKVIKKYDELKDKSLTGYYQCYGDEITIIKFFGNPELIPKDLIQHEPYDIVFQFIKGNASLEENKGKYIISLPFMKYRKSIIDISDRPKFIIKD